MARTVAALGPEGAHVSGSPDRHRFAVDTVESMRLPPQQFPGGAARPRPVAHMVGYAHLDPVWLWPWTEGYAEARATLRSAVDRLGEFPEFVYTFTSVV